MTSSKSSDNRILKVDTLKRVRVPKARREAILDEFERSGLSGAAFAKLHGLKYGTFATWLLKRRKQASRGAVGGLRSSHHRPGDSQTHMTRSRDPSRAFARWRLAPTRWRCHSDDTRHSDSKSSPSIAEPYHAQFHRQPQDLPRHRTQRHAQKFQWPSKCRQRAPQS